ncbi:Multidrug resistance protein [Staphylococcus aureus]|uniref:Multidrug resistance protein n=1 Tax=Staphylococcus aureus TaxID=1280 RepID=A0A380E560_STAAU|nr:Multidrug resistance protein [Staphylococcus aureus]
MLGFGGGMIIPAIYAMAGAVWPNGGRQTFNAIYLAQNIGVAVGAAMGGFVAEFSFNYIFLANLIMYVVFALVAVTQFNIEINAKVKYPTHLDITGKKNKARFISLVLILQCCNLLGCVYSMGVLQSHHLHNLLIFQWHNIVFYGQLTE